MEKFATGVAADAKLGHHYQIDALRLCLTETGDYMIGVGLRITHLYGRNVSRHAKKAFSHIYNNM